MKKLRALDSIKSSAVSASEVLREPGNDLVGVAQVGKKLVPLEEIAADRNSLIARRCRQKGSRRPARWPT